MQSMRVEQRYDMAPTQLEIKITEQEILSNVNLTYSKFPRDQDHKIKIREEVYLSLWS